jgi:hypothetical protein
MAPWIIASFFAVNISCRVCTGLSLPFPNSEWAKAMHEVQKISKDAKEEEDFEILSSLETWANAHPGNDEAQIINPEESDRLLNIKRLTGKSYRAFSAEARLEKNYCCWSNDMELQVTSNGEIMCIMIVAD